MSLGYSKEKESISVCLEDAPPVHEVRTLPEQGCHFGWGQLVPVHGHGEAAFASGRATHENNPYPLMELLKASCCPNSGCLEERGQRAGAMGDTSMGDEEKMCGSIS